MEKIIVLGNEDFTLGFELIGIEAMTIDSIDEILANKFNVGIVIISKVDYDSLSSRLKNMISKSLKPIVIILSKEDLRANSLRDKIIKAMGVDLMK